METLRAGLVCVPGGATTGIDAKDTWLRAAAIVITRNRETEITPGAKTDSILVESGLELQQILYQLGILWDEAETMFKSQHRSRSDEVNKYLNFPNIVKTKHKVLFLFPISYQREKEKARNKRKGKAKALSISSAVRKAGTRPMMLMTHLGMTTSGRPRNGIPGIGQKIPRKWTPICKYTLNIADYGLHD